MLSENIKAARKAKGLSQEELAIKINVVRQTVSKWEQGLSVPDSDLLIALAEALETSVSALLGEAVAETQTDSLRAISEKLEIINLQLARRKETHRKILHWGCIALGALVVIAFSVVLAASGVYLSWDYGDPETAVAVAGLHAIEWVFVRIAPFALIGSIVGAVLTRKKR